MFYVTNYVINVEPSAVWDALVNPEVMPNWMPTLKNREQITGKSGEQGSRAKLVFQNGKKEMEMSESVLESKVNELLLVEYTTTGVVNLQKLKIVASEDGKTTKIIAENDFQFESLFMKLFGWILKFLFVSETNKYFNLLKQVVEPKI